MRDSLISALEGEDDLGVVIRSHIITEQYINKLIESRMVNIESYRSAKIEYHTKIQLVVGLGLDSRFIPFLKCLGSLRNKFAHELKREINKQDANNLYECLNENDKTVLNQSLDKTTIQITDTPSLKECTPKQKYIYCVVVICAALQSACNLSQIQNNH